MSEPTIVNAINGNCVLVRWDFLNERNVVNILSRFRSIVLEHLLEKGCAFDGNIKWYIALKIKLVKVTQLADSARNDYQDAIFHSRSRIIVNIRDNMHEVGLQYTEGEEKIMENLNKFTNEGSGWSVDSILQLDLNIVRYRPIHGASSSYIEMPVGLKKKRGIVEIKNQNDNMCFLWAILSYFNEKPKHNRVKDLKNLKRKVNMIGMEYPVAVKNIDKFEQQNPNIGVNVLAYEEEEDRIYPHRITDHQNREHLIHLLLVTGKNRDHFHYNFINTRPGHNGLSMLLAGLTKHTNAVHYCPRCFHRFTCNLSVGRDGKANLEAHLEMCGKHSPQRIKIPNPEKPCEAIMMFRNYSATLKVPYTIYADFESFIVPMDSTQPAPDFNMETDLEEEEEDTPLAKSYTEKKAKHVPCGYCYVIVDENGNIYKEPTLYRATTENENIIKKMLDEMLEDAKLLKPKLKECIPMKLSKHENSIFYNTINCYLCKQFLGEDRVRHHCHTNGAFLGACHNICNLKARKANHIPVFFHNLRGYDAHHIIQALGDFDSELYNITVIANSSEKFTSFSIDSLRFVDSLQFLSASLDTLVNNLANGCDNKRDAFKIMTSHFLRESIEDLEDNAESTPLLDLLTRKGVYPYEYMTDVSKFEETCLPPIENFYSSIREEDVSAQDYEHAQEVWRRFKLKSLGCYHSLYLVTDVLLLSVVFENYRNLCIKYYEIDPCHFYSTPHLSWDAMLKMTGVKLDLLTDIDMHLFIESGIRGGVAMISNRYAKANNPEVPETYDSTKPNEWLIYFDKNNLYGCSLADTLPEGGFQWMSEEDKEKEPWKTCEDTGVEGYILEVDLKYPHELHDVHSDYPLAPEGGIPGKEKTSPFIENLKRAPVKKLLTTLNDKEKYILHYRNLKQYTSLGMKVVKVHRVLKFRQSQWLKTYIDFNTEKRKMAKNDFEKDLFKLMNNAVYGKSLENVRNRIEFHIVTKPSKLDKLIAKPRVKRWFVYNENVVGISLKKLEVNFNRPIYVGFTVLDLSKYFMYEFHYNYIVEKYGSNAKLLMTDTDSLVYNIKTENVYKDMLQDDHLFDTSNYPKDHICYNEKNKKVLGKMKDELAGNPAKEFVGLMAKLYSILLNDNTEKKVAKGVPRIAIRKQLRHDSYKQCLEQHKCTFVSTHGIRSESHNIYSIKQCKKALSPWDDKRYVLPDGKATLAYGHYKIINNAVELSDTFNVAGPSKRSQTPDDNGTHLSKRLKL